MRPITAQEDYRQRKRLAHIGIFSTTAPKAGGADTHLCVKTVGQTIFRHEKSRDKGYQRGNSENNGAVEGRSECYR
jgi:hypothetical protein